MQSFRGRLGVGTMSAVYKPVTHVLFDLDGVIVDTEKVYTKAVQTMAKRYGKEYTWELNLRVMGTPEEESASLVVDSLGLPISPEEYLSGMDKIYAEMFSNVELMPGIQRLVEHLHANKVPIAIATSSKPSSFQLKTIRYCRLVALFNHVVCSGGNPEVKKGKPHPDVFLVAASKFDDRPPPEKVLVFEDSLNGVTAALAAGMQVVMIPDPRIDEEKRHRATLCIASLLDFKPELFGLPRCQVERVLVASAGPGRLCLVGASSNGRRGASIIMAAIFKPVTHVLFDLDGVILDTDQMYTDAVQAVAGRYGKQYTWELTLRAMGTPASDSARLIIDDLGLPMNQDEYLAEMDCIFADMLPMAELKPGVERLVRHLHAHKVPMAIATSSKPASFELKTSRHHGLVALFNHVICTGDDTEVKQGKPHPDVFLVAASKFADKPPPEKVLVLEDAPKGVTAALAAGMQVVMIPDPRMDEQNRCRATLCIASLLDFKPELFGLPPF
ncbi:uncharacterized protein LOC144166824 [Haemaphysalis longicornis]